MKTKQVLTNNVRISNLSKSSFLSNVLNSKYFTKLFS